LQWLRVTPILLPTELDQLNVRLPQYLSQKDCFRYKELLF
jgi:hypothetical protein